MWIVDKLRGLDRLRVHLLNLAQPTNEEIKSKGSVKPVASVFNQPLNQNEVFHSFLRHFDQLFGLCRSNQW